MNRVLYGGTSVILKYLPFKTFLVSDFIKLSFSFTLLVVFIPGGQSGINPSDSLCDKTPIKISEIWGWNLSKGQFRTKEMSYYFGEFHLSCTQS